MVNENQKYKLPLFPNQILVKARGTENQDFFQDIKIFWTKAGNDDY